MAVKKITPAQKRALTITRNRRRAAALRGWETRLKNERKRQRELRRKALETSKKKVQRGDAAKAPLKKLRKLPPPKRKTGFPPPPLPRRKKVPVQVPKPKPRRGLRKKKPRFPYEELSEYLAQKVTETVEESEESETYVFSDLQKKIRGPITVLRLDVWMGRKTGDNQTRSHVRQLVPVSSTDIGAITEQVLKALPGILRKKDEYFYVIIKGKNKRGQIGYRTLPKMIL